MIGQQQLERLKLHETLVVILPVKELSHNPWNSFQLNCLVMPA
jgi:hypothetical protein